MFNERYNADRGFSGALYCTLPGSGLGTYPSECLAYLKAIAHVNNIEPLGWEYAEFVSRIENDYLKESSGTPGSLPVIQGKKDCMIYSDKGSVNITAHPGLRCGSDYNILIAYSGQVCHSSPPDLERRREEIRKATTIIIMTMTMMVKKNFMVQIQTILLVIHMISIQKIQITIVYVTKKRISTVPILITDIVPQQGPSM